jgi:hypothetical protein
MPVIVAPRAVVSGPDIEMPTPVRTAGRRYGFNMAPTPPVKGPDIEQPRPDAGREVMGVTPATLGDPSSARLAPATREVPTPPAPLRQPNTAARVEPEAPAPNPAPKPAQPRGAAHLSRQQQQGRQTS